MFSKIKPFLIVIIPVLLMVGLYLTTHKTPVKFPPPSVSPLKNDTAASNKMLYVTPNGTYSYMMVSKAVYLGHEFLVF